MMKLKICIALFVVVLISAWLRIGIPYHDVMDNGVKFTTVDSYLYMRMADYAYDNNLAAMNFDPLMGYPNGSPVSSLPLTSIIVAFIAKTFGLPLDNVSALFPAILGVLLAVLVFILAALVFNKWVGLLSSLLIAIMPGEILGRTMIGNIDHDALEAFLIVSVLIFIVLGFKKHYLYGIGAGICLGLYNLNWSGAPLFTLLLLIYYVGFSILNRYRRIDNVRLLSVFSWVFTFGLIGYSLTDMWNMQQNIYMLFFGVSCAIPYVLYGLDYITRKKKPYYYVGFLVAVALIGFLAIYIIQPKYIEGLGQGLSSFLPGTQSGLAGTVSEMMPLFWYRGSLDLTTPWSYYGLCLYIGISGMWLFLVRNWRRPENLLLVFWCIVTTILVLLQKRYGYYTAISLSIFTAYILWTIIKGISLRKLSRQDRKQGKNSVNIGNAIMVSVVILLFVVAPIFRGAVGTVSGMNDYMITPAWYSALKWMKSSTPEKLDYSVISWWDYGYWITREAKRPVIVHPGGGDIIAVSRLLLSKDEDVIEIPQPNMTLKAQTTNEYIKSSGVRYIILDYMMLSGKFYAIPECAGYTPKVVGDSLIYRLFFNNGTEKWKEVWASKEVYMKESQVKIFEYIGEK